MEIRREVLAAMALMILGLIIITATLYFKSSQCLANPIDYQINKFEKSTKADGMICKCTSPVDHGALFFKGQGDYYYCSSEDLLMQKCGDSGRAPVMTITEIDPVTGDSIQ